LSRCAYADIIVPNNKTAAVPATATNFILIRSIGAHTGTSAAKLLRAERPPACIPKHEIRSVEQMLWTIAVILFVLWALGLATSYTLSGFVHILLVLAIVVVLIRVIQGRRPVL
jgi:hypothetical protein